MDIRGRRFFCSWSGGKDSCLALYRALQNGGVPYSLFTMLNESGERSHSHALPVSLLQKQAAALQIPLRTQSATWGTYESVFIAETRRLNAAGVEVGVFGDIDIADHRLWEEKVCAAANMDAWLPLWQEPRLQLVEEFMAMGFVARIVTVKDSALDESYLGRELNSQLIAELLQKGVDPSGEAGEFHTVVTAGPVFKHQVDLQLGQIVRHEGYSFISCS